MWVRAEPVSSACFVPDPLLSTDLSKVIAKVTNYYS